MSFPQPRVLIAEDESGIADTLQYVLKSDGFVPVWCATAQAALAEFASQPPAIVILDIGLPDMNGFELFKRLQAMSRGLRHAAACPAPSHTECPTFKRLLKAASSGAIERRWSKGAPKRAKLAAKD